MPQNQARPTSPIEQKILFVSGKGGVGKSVIAAGVARREASAGKRVLLVEIGDNSYYRDFFQLSEVGAEPTRLAEYGFDLAMWSGETCLREYVLFYLRLERLYHIFFENKVMRSLVNVAPGLNEIAILGKITSGIRKVGPPLEYDLIVVDCYATGHALALFEAPRGMHQAIGFGPMGHHSREIDAVIRDPKLTAYWAVTLLEEMPVIETLEFRERLQKELGASALIVANKVLEAPVGKAELRALIDAEPAGLGEFARYLESILTRQEHYLSQLSAARVPFVEVPLLLTNDADVLIGEVREALRTA